MIEGHTFTISVLVICPKITARIGKLAPWNAANTVPIVISNRSLHRAYLNFNNITHHKHISAMQLSRGMWTIFVFTIYLYNKTHQSKESWFYFRRVTVINVILWISESKLNMLYGNVWKPLTSHGKIGWAWVALLQDSLIMAYC